MNQPLTKTAPHRIAFVEEDELPPGQDFAFVECEGELWLAMKRGRVSPSLLEDAWATYRLMV